MLTTSVENPWSLIGFAVLMKSPRLYISFVDILTWVEPDPYYYKALYGIYRIDNEICADQLNFN